MPSKQKQEENAMIFGACYYPEHWDRSEWAHHARLMREAGFNTVRMGDFAWGVMEPEEEQFDFSLMDDAIQVLAAEGIDVILCTPTAGPPKWLAEKYDILQRDRYGRKKNWGARREGCANSADYRKRSVRIAREMAQHFGDNPHVIAWQIDNEFGCHSSTRCYCENCRRAFAGWLEKKYGDIDNLNKAWGTVFWSLQYASFADVILPVYNSCEPENAQSWSHNPSLDLEYRRFASDSWAAYQKLQIDAVRQYSDKPVTHNFMGHFSDIDYYDLAGDLDLVAWDNYPDNQWGSSEYEYVSMAHENMRGLKDANFIVAEQQSGPCGWDIMGAAPEPGQLRLWTYQALAHGGEGIVYFRFRALPYGMEQYWYGVLDQDGIPRRRYRELKETGEELRKLESYIVGAKNKYQALIVKSYDNAWAHSIKRHAAGFDYESLLYAYYRANADLNIAAAVSMGSYEGYKVVYMPAYNLVDPEELRKVTEYVRGGGTLVTTFRSGGRDLYNNLFQTTLPCAFAELAGIEVEEFTPLRKPAHIKGIVESEASVWCDVIEPLTAKVLCSYADHYFAGRAAVTVNRFGEGSVYYVGCDLEPEALKKLVRYISEAAGVEMWDAPKGVEIVRREGCVILLNHNDYAVETNVTGRSLLSGETFDGKLAGYGVEFVV
ncbi:MAG: beta-galactosidase [Candidatus Gastranaerophilales bacterium]|nr:beta-galactosidase [Candidatus Gastranaerophilales bacterium]